MPDETADHVWNKGIARLCDRQIPDEFPDGIACVHMRDFVGVPCSAELPSDLIADPERFHDVREGEIVWVRIGWLCSFVRQVLPIVRAVRAGDRAFREHRGHGARRRPARKAHQPLLGRAEARRRGDFP